MGTLDLNQAEFLFRSDAVSDPTLRVFRFQGRESISQPFEFTVELVSENPDLDIESPISQSASLTLRGRNPDGSNYERQIHGVIERFVQLSAGIRHSRYEATLVPTFKPLHYTRDSRIFQQLSTSDVVQKVLREGQVQAELLLHGQYGPRDYCVQYQESDLDFVQRLLEEEGIFYFFEHRDEREVMIIGDGSHAFDQLPAYSTARLHDKPHLYEEGLFELRAETMLRPGAAVLRDYRFKQPGLDMEASAQSDRFRQYELYYFPGDYVDAGLGRRLATVRMEEQQCQRSRYIAQSNVRAATPGYKFTLTGHRRKDSNQEYLIVAVQHEGTQPGALAEESGGGIKEPVYKNRLECIPANVSYRPPRLTPRPSIPGVQTARVVGPAGEEIHCDVDGRVKVQFHWDREGQRNDSSSCWIRVSQPWGGAGQGGMFIPRVTQEVIIQFLEGDPDRPIIIGRVYNGENPVPHGLPAAKNISTIRSASTPGGSGFNELRFDDSAGAEEIFFHAQKDHNEVVGNNHSAQIAANQSNTVGADQCESIGSNQSLTVGSNRSAVIGANEDIVIGSNRSLTIGSNQTTTVGVDHQVHIGSNQSVNIGVNETVNVGSTQTVTIGSLQEVTAGQQKITVLGPQTTTVAGPDSLTALGGYTIAVTGALDATASVSAKLAAPNIDIDGSAVKTSGISVKTEGVFVTTEGVMVKIKGVSVGVKGACVTIEGAGSVEVKGGTVNVKGSTVSIDGSSSTKISGGSVDIVGGGAVTAKAGVIKLNC